MTKAEKYWVFGMILMLSVTHKEVPTLLSSIGNVLSYIGAIGCFIAMTWCAFRGEK
jgi:hypothetical protein